jgi:predicted amidohydrolase YtcJ
MGMTIQVRQSNEEVRRQSDQNGPTLKLLVWHYEDGLLTGMVEHVGGANLTEATVQFRAFDKDGARISTATDSIGYLHPGEKWSFRTAVTRHDEADRLDFYQFVCFSRKPEEA